MSQQTALNLEKESGQSTERVGAAASLRDILLERFGDRLRVNTSLTGREVTTFGLGGVLDLVCEPRDISVLTELLPFLRGQDVPWRVLGAGSNLIINDCGVGGVVLRLGSEFSGFCFISGKETPEELFLLSRAQVEPREGEQLLFALGGASLMGLSRRASQWGLAGLEFAAGIPGSVGGAVRMNAGAHGACMSDVVTEVMLLTQDGKGEFVPASELHFGYRRSLLPEGAVVLGAKFLLTGCERELLSRRRTSCLEYRKRTQPLQLPSAGSVFRNPESDSVLFNGERKGESPSGEPHGKRELSAGMLIERAGLKGVTQGGVQFSPLHANWLVRVTDEAKAADALLLMKLAEEEIWGRYRIELEREIVVW